MPDQSFHLRADLQGALRQSDSHLEGMFQLDGQPAPGHVVRKQIQVMLSKGVEFIPVGECDNWNEDEQRCAGHPVEERP